jgi:hypothetical protein
MSSSKFFDSEKLMATTPSLSCATIVLLQRNLLRLREYQASLRKGLEQQQQ